MRHILLITLCMLVAPAGYAANGKMQGITIPISLVFWQLGSEEKIDDTESESSTTQTYYNLNLGVGYTTAMGIYFGLKYAMANTNTASEGESTIAGTTVSSTTDTVKSDSGFGLSIGLNHSTGISFIATYLASHDSVTDWENNSGGDVTKSTSERMGGSGYMLELGYIYKLKSIGLGPLLSYKSVSYDEETTKSTIGGIELESETKGTFTDTEIIPSMGLWFVF